VYIPQPPIIFSVRAVYIYALLHSTDSKAIFNGVLSVAENIGL
jgi:hypothetical protein